MRHVGRFWLRSIYIFRHVIYTSILPSESESQAVAYQHLLWILVSGMSLANHASEVGAMKLGGISMTSQIGEMDGSDRWDRLKFWLFDSETPTLICFELSIFKSDSKRHVVQLEIPRSWLLKLVEVEDGGEVCWCWTLGCWTVLRRLQFGFPCCVDWTCCSSRLDEPKCLRISRIYFSRLGKTE